MFTSDILYKILRQFTSKQEFLIAYSGGLDSHVLLHSMVMIRRQYPDMVLQAIHINHGLSPNADLWQEHCRTICQSLHVPLIAKKIHLNPLAGESLEAVARAARYEAFKEILKTDQCLLTAHTQNDQAETVLLQLFRGAGVKGLCAMPEKMTFHENVLLRPLLSFTRHDLEIYTKENQLVAIHDESNDNLDFDRNYIRHQIMPIIQKRWPGALKTVSRSAKLCVEAEEALETLAAKDYEEVCDVNDTLSIHKLLILDESRQRNVLRFWLKKLNFTMPSRIKIERIQNEVIRSRSDAKAVVCWNSIEVRRYQGRLYAFSSLTKCDNTWKICWDMQTPLTLPDKRLLVIDKLMGQGISLEQLIDKKIYVSFRQGGERCDPVGRAGSRSLKKLFQEWHIPFWQRDYVPLIFINDQLAHVPGFCVDKKFAAKSDEEGILVKVASCYSSLEVA